MRLPNGFGNVSKLSGKRRNPWRARKTAGWVIDEKTQKIKQTYVTIGYYATRQQALQVLSEYNTNPYDLDANNITFAEVYEKWSDKKFDEISASNVNAYKAAYKMCFFVSFVISLIFEACAAILSLILLMFNSKKIINIVSWGISMGTLVIIGILAFVVGV